MIVDSFTPEMFMFQAKESQGMLKSINFLNYHLLSFHSMPVLC